VVDPVLTEHMPATPYPQGSWGPAAADALMTAHGGWHNPSVLSPPAKDTP